jgi:cytidyltransferase-like protein
MSPLQAKPRLRFCLKSLISGRILIDNGTRVHYCWHACGFSVIYPIHGRECKYGSDSKPAEKKEFTIEILRTIEAMRSYSSTLRQSGKTIAFVPTMGFLHEGHLSLMKKGRELADRVVVSIFVNPIQFGPSEDLAAYPKDEARDLEMTEKTGVDAVFMPDAEKMYPGGFQTTISLKALPAHLCGLSRPGHFDGVATVVAKLLGIVRPHMAIFGEKD